MSDEGKKEKISDFARKLTDLIEQAPDNYARHDLYRALHFLRKRYAISPEKKKAMIRQLIADGATTFTEIHVESGFSRHQVDRAIKTLLIEKLIRSEKISITGMGRPKLCYFPI